MPNSYGSWRTGVQIDNIYPVGSLYFSINATNPGQLFGGTWEQIKDKFFLSAGNTYTAGATGGNATHTHSQVSTTSGGPSNNTSGSTAISVAQMPAHNHGSAGSHSHTFSQAGWQMAINTTSQGDGVDNGHGFTHASNGWWHMFKINVGTFGSAGAHTHTTQGSGSGHTHTLSSHTHTTAATTTGSGSSLPPYLVVYVFKRTA